MTSKKVWAVGVIVLAAFFFLAPSTQGQTGPSAAVTANQRARVSVPVDWSTDYVVAPMIQWGGVRILPTNEPRVLHRRLLAQPRANGRMVSPYVSGSVYFERGDDATNDVPGQAFDNDGPVRDRRLPSRGRPPRRFPQRGLVTDWSFPSSGFLAGSVVGSPAKFNFDVNATPDCTADILYVPVNVAGSSTVANLIALNNLYTNPDGTGACSGTAPTIVWTMGFTGSIQTSPVLSLDGTLLFVVESLSTGAVVHAIRTGSVTCTGACTLTNAATPSTPTNRLWSATLVAVANENDTISSPFIQYTFVGNDELFVGSDQGVVHRFANILTSSGAEVTTGGWPVTVASGIQLSSPTVDFATGNLFVGNANGVLHRVTISNGSVTNSATVGGGASGGIVDAPVIDVTNARVLVATGNSSGAVARIAQFAETFGAGTSPTATGDLGQGGQANMHRPAFDNAFLTGGNGFTYVGGVSDSTSAADTLIYRFPYSNASGLGSPSATVPLASTATPVRSETSPVTVFSNANRPVASREFAYISGLASPEQSINRINTATFSSVANSTSEPGGTSPIIVDNIGTNAEQSNIYFGTRNSNFSKVIKLRQVF